MYIIHNKSYVVNQDQKRSLTISGRFFVLEWQTVTVALFHVRRAAMGDPCKTN